MSLPVILAPVRRRNPAWVRGGDQEYYIEIETEVEVVQLNLNTGGMRVRWEEPNAEKKKGFEVMSTDIDISHFYKHYSIVSNYKNG